MTHKELTAKAVAILRKAVEPPYRPDADTVADLLGLFDGPDYRAAVAAEGE